MGNRTAQTQTITGTLVTTYTYDAANRLTSVNGVPYSWDANGNLLNDGSKVYTYTQANRLITVTAPGLTWSATYNGDGARLRTVGNSVLTTYTQDLAAPLPVVLQAKTGTAATQYLFGLGTRPLAEYDSAWAYLLPDGLGSVRQLADGNGNVTLSESYEPYGSVLTSQGSATSALGYTGEQTDSTGLVFLRARYMRPGLGMFLSRDLWGGDELRPGALNGWNYVEGSPVNWTDPSGLCAISGATDCERFVSEVQCLIEGVRNARECHAWLKLISEEELVLDLLARYYSGIPSTLRIPIPFHLDDLLLYMPFIPQGTVFQQGDPDRWAVPRWDQQRGSILDWDHPINQRQSDLGRAMRQSYGFKRPYFENTHHYFAFLKFAYYWGGPPVEWMNKQRELEDQVKKAFKDLKENPGSPAHIQYYAWNYREAVYDLYIVHEAAQLAVATAFFGVDIIPAKLKTWCANNEADVWSLESEVDRFYFDFPREYWPDKQFWPGR